jgi:hypothetical protein
VLKAWRVGYRLLNSAPPEHLIGGGTPSPAIVDGSAKSEQAQQALGWFQLGLRELEPYEVEGAFVIDWREVKVSQQFAGGTKGPTEAMKFYSLHSWKD